MKRYKLPELETPIFYTERKEDTNIITEFWLNSKTQLGATWTYIIGTPVAPALEDELRSVLVAELTADLKQRGLK